MAKSEVPGGEVDPFESERPRLVGRLAKKFPTLDAGVVADVVDRTAKATENAKVKSFRAVLVEHAARDELTRLAG